jgi:hypothetical protein
MTSLAEVEGLEFKLVDLIARLRPGARRTDCSTALGNLRIAKRGMLARSDILRKSTGTFQSRRGRSDGPRGGRSASQTFTAAAPATMTGALAEVRKALARPYSGDGGLIKLLTTRGTG